MRIFTCVTYIHVSAMLEAQMLSYWCSLRIFSHCTLKTRINLNLIKVYAGMRIYLLLDSILSKVSSTALVAMLSQSFNLVNLPY
jgi:hypothetical protein